MRPETAVKKFAEFFEQSKKRKDIFKPVSWSLYQAWKYCDTYEKPRRVEDENEMSKMWK